jgi:hypothetical protein
MRAEVDGWMEGEGDGDDARRSCRWMYGDGLKMCEVGCSLFVRRRRRRRSSRSGTVSNDADAGQAD